MKKILIVLLVFSCQSNSKKDDHVQLAYSVFETLRQDDFNKFQLFFMPHKVNGLQADGVDEAEYYKFVSNSFTKSIGSFERKGLKIEDFKITDVTELVPRLSQRVYGGKKFEFFEFYVFLENDKKESYRAQMKCIKIENKYWFRDNVAVIKFPVE
ncbi:hypothetical protein ABN763_12895 [Spongiivirga sp. MCCC 1A20706]|uniref:hypothetical protein n=1 Tax=Spongiivirga sp. MCCC 1A20706 TaxID=3160963 RepID=UPI0039777F19